MSTDPAAGAYKIWGAGAVTPLRGARAHMHTHTRAEYPVSGGGQAQMFTAGETAGHEVSTAFP